MSTRHTGPPPATVDTTGGLGGALRRAVATPARRWIVASTALLGVLVAVLAALALPADERTLAIIAFPVHMLMSVVLPFLGVLIGRDLRTDRAARAGPAMAVAVLAGAATGLLGDLLSVAALAAAGSAPPGAWSGAPVILLGGVLVQTVANLTGTGLGILIRPAWLACLATIAIPLGVWGLLQLAGPAAVVAGWTTPFPVAGTLLSGDVDPIDWARWAVVALLWGVALNASALRLVHRGRAA